ncbi:MAG TPA: hypothetical protein VKM54_08440 [Myxococcota bacterium]|nr:hypothetical protein [Myxococcota bacterium]
MEKAPTEGVFPGFGALPEYGQGPFITVHFPVDLFRLFMRKLACGVTWIHESKLLTDEYEVRWIPYTHDGWLEVNEAVDTFGARPLDCGPGVLLRRAPTSEDPIVSLIRLELWGQLKLIAHVRRKDRPLTDSLMTWQIA